MLASAEPTLPVLMAGYPTLSQCRLELVHIAKIDVFRSCDQPFCRLLQLSKSEETNKSVLAFCVKDIRNI